MSSAGFRVEFVARPVMFAVMNEIMDLRTQRGTLREPVDMARSESQLGCWL